MDKGIVKGGEDTSDAEDHFTCEDESARVGVENGFWTCAPSRT